MEKRNNIKAVFITTIIIILLVSFFLLNSFKTVLYDKQFYSISYEKNGVYDKYGEELVDSSTENLFSYLQEGSPLSSFFSEQDKAHMIDVKSLIEKANFYYYLSLVLIVFCFLMLYIMDKKGFYDKIANAFVMTLLITLFIGIICYSLKGFFSEIFIGFHHIFFDNELWIMDPAKDMLVNLFPEQFFYDITSLILIRTLWSAIAIGIIGVLMKVGKKKLGFDD